MGKFTAFTPEVASFVATGDRDTVGVGDAVAIDGDFAFAVFGDFTGTGRLVHSFDGGASWLPITYGDGEAKIFSTPERVILDEPERGVLFRFEVLTRTSGTFKWRFAK